jgi:hypothetical protein
MAETQRTFGETDAHVYRHPDVGGFTWFRTTLRAMAMMRKGQVRNIGGRDIRTQATFIAGPFQVAA